MMPVCMFRVGSGFAMFTQMIRVTWGVRSLCPLVVSQHECFPWTMKRSQSNLNLCDRSDELI
jgi:hypothetical protein